MSRKLLLKAKGKNSSSGEVRTMTILPWATTAAVILLSWMLLSDGSYGQLRSALFQLGTGGAPPTNGIYVSKLYQALPNERGSILIQTAETLNAFEGMQLTFAVDASRASIVKVRRTAAAQQFHISYNFVAAGVVHVSMVGNPKNIAQGTALLEVEMQLMDRTANTTASRLDLRLLNLRLLTDSNRIRTDAHDGLITFVSSQNALSIPFIPHIADVEPGIFPLVRHAKLIIRGKALPISPQVLIGKSPAGVISASSTEIVATIPEDMLPGKYAVSVESLLSDEEVVVFDTPGPSGSVDIIDELMFINPNPVLFTDQSDAAGIVLWVPVFNPLGSDKAVTGSVDFSSIGGSPNVVFTGIGSPAIGPGGAMVNWFRVPETGTLSLSKSLQTNVDYPIPVRVENSSMNRDQSIPILMLRSRIAQGGMPSIGRIETSPVSPVPGDSVSLFVDVSDPDGISTLQIVSVRMISLGGGVLELSPAIEVPSNGAPMTTVAYTGQIDLPQRTTAGDYPLEVYVLDKDGNESVSSFTITIRDPGQQSVGSPPEYSGRLEASPKVAALGAPVTLYVGVRDSDGTDTIKQVTVDLVDLKGGIIELQPIVPPVPGSTQSVVYSGKFTLSSTIGVGAYSIGVKAVDQEGNVSLTLLPLSVSAIGQSSGSPVVIQAIATPATVPSDNETQFFITAEIEDAEGIDTISAVRANLTPLNIGIKSLRIDSNTSSKEGRKGFYVSEKLKIPTTVKSGIYDISVEAEDKEGLRGNKLVRITVGTESLGGDAPIIRESRFVPETVRPGGRTRLFVEIEDKNGTKDIKAVADLTDLRLDIKELDALIKFPAGTVISRNTFATDTFTIPSDLPQGVYDIPLLVADDTNNVIRTVTRMRVEKGGELQGQSPKISVQRSFQVPRVFANDNKGTNEIQVLVQDPDDDVVTVIANLGSLARAKGANILSEVGGLTLLCSESLAIVCMQKSVPEGISGRWFVLADISVPSTTLPGSDPYFIDLTAIDLAGHTDTARIPITIGGSETVQMLQTPPSILSIVPVNEREIEVVLSTPVNALTVNRAGEQFRLQSSLDAFSSIAVRKVSWDTTGRYLYIETDTMAAGETYTFSVVTDAKSTSAPLTDVYGNRFSSDHGGTYTFAGYSSGGQAPAIESVKVVDDMHLDVTFRGQVLPSSVHPDLLSTSASLVSTLTGERTSILGGELIVNARVLRLTTDRLREGDRYTIKLSGVLAPGLLSNPSGIEKTFIALFPGRGAAGDMQIFPTADLNKDGRVDFSDFALFSAVYDSQYDMSRIQSLIDSDNESDKSHTGNTKNSAPSIAAPKQKNGQSLGGDLPNFSF